MIKKIILISLTFLLSSLIYSNSITDNMPDEDIIKYSNIKTNLSFVSKYADEQNDLAKAEKTDTILKYCHISFAAITYASLWALDAIGIPLLYFAFTDPESPYYDGLKYAHLGVASSTLATFSTMLILAFIKLGLKLKNNVPIRKPHFIAAIVLLSFYVLELSTIILSAVFFANKYEGAKWVGMAHGITSGATTLAFSVSLVTIFF